MPESLDPGVEPRFLKKILLLVLFEYFVDDFRPDLKFAIL